MAFWGLVSSLAKRDESDRMPKGFKLFTSAMSVFFSALIKDKKYQSLGQRV
jgi:hypothetical protein